MALVITGASLLGETTADLYVDDAGLLVDEAPGRRRDPRRRRPGRAARPRRPAHPPARARSRGRRDDPHRLAGRGARRLHRRPGDGQHLAGHRHRRGRRCACCELGREAGLVDVQPVGAVTRGLGGEELAELGLMARSRAQVRVFSDDGKCVHDARVMRRALEYVKAFGGVVSQHSQDPALAGPTACCHEGELSGRLGLPGWPGIAEEVIVARDVMLARHTGSRVHVAHVSTAGSVEVMRWAKAQGDRRHRRGHAAPPAADHRPARRLRPDLQGQPAAAPRRGRRTRCATRWPTARSTPSPPTTPRTRATTRSTRSSTRRSACSASRPRSASSRTVHGPDVSWADVARVMSTDPGAHRRARRSGAVARPRARRPTSSSSIPTPRSPSTATHSASLSRNNPWHGRTPDRRGSCTPCTPAG